MKLPYLYALGAALIALSASAFADNGGKYWTSEGELSPALATEILSYAQMAEGAFLFESRAIHVPGFAVAQDASLFPGPMSNFFVGTVVIENKERQVNAFVDENTGLRARLFRSDDGKTYVLAFTGSETDLTNAKKWSRLMKNMSTNYNNYIGREDTAYYEASVWTADIAQDLPEGSHLVVTGVSLGGALAQYVAMLYPDRVERAYCFNAPGMGAGHVMEIIKCLDLNGDSADLKVSPKIIKALKSLAIEGDRITHVYVQGEWLSAYHSGYWFGKEYTVPFYTQEWYAYYMNSHHNALAVVKSIKKQASSTEEPANGAQDQATSAEKPAESARPTDLSNFYRPQPPFSQQGS